MPSQELGLGVLFQGRVDAAFRTAVSQLDSILNKLNGSLGALQKKATGVTQALNSGGSELSAYQKAMGNATGESTKYQQALSRILNSTTKTDAAIKKSVSTLNKVEGAIQSTANRMTAAGKNGARFAETANRINLTNQKLSGTLRVVGGEFQKVAQVSAGARAMVQNLTKQFGAASGASKAAAAATQPFHRGLLHIRDAARGAETYAGRLNYAISSMTAWIPAAIAVSTLVQGIYSGIAAIKDFNQALKNLQAIANLTDVETGQLGVKILEVAANTKYSATEVADALVLIEQAGFSASEAIETIDAVANLAVGTLSDMKTTSDLVTTALRVFNLEAVESGRVSDVFANAVNRSKLTIDKLRTSLNYLGPIASSAGLTIEETAAATMIMANAGLRASTIGTGLRQVFARILSPTSKFRAAIEEAGLSVEDFSFKTEGVAKVMGNLGKVIKDPGEALRVFGLRAGNAAVLLSKLGEKGFTYMVQQASEAGSAMRMAETQMEGLGVASKNLLDRLQNVAVVMGEGGLGKAALVLINLLRQVIGLVGSLTNTLGGVFVSSWLGAAGAIWLVVKALRALIALGLSAWFGTSISFMRQLIVQFGLMAVVTNKVIPSVSLLGAGIRALGGYVKALIGVIIGYNSVVTVAQAKTQLLNSSILLSPWGWVIAAIAAVVAAFWTYEKAVERSRIRSQSLLDEHVRNVKMLELYSDRLEQTQNIQDNYNSQLDRLIQDFPLLKKQIDATNGSYKEHSKVLAEAIEAEKQLATDRYLENRKKILDQFEDTKQELKELNLVYRIATDTASDYEKVIFNSLPSFKRLAYMIREVGSALGFMKSNEEKAIEELRKRGKAMDQYTRTLAKNARAQEKLHGIDIDPEAFFPKELLERGTRLMQHLDDFEEAMKEMGRASEEFGGQYLVLTDILGDVTTDALDEATAKWINYYHTVDDLGRANVMVHADNMRKSLKELQENAKKLEYTEEQTAAERLKIIQKHYDEMLEEADVHYTKLFELIQQSYENQNNEIEAQYKERSRNAELAYQEELAAANSLIDGQEIVAQKRSEITKKYFDQERFDSQQHYQELKTLTEAALETLREAYEDSYEARNAETGELNKDLLETEKKLFEDLEKAGKDYYDSMLARYKKLSDERDSHLDKAKDAAKQRADLERSISNEIKEIDRGLLDEQARSLSVEEDMRRSLYDAMVKAQAATTTEQLEVAKEYAKESKALIDDLVGYEIERDEQGRIKFIESAFLTAEKKKQALLEYQDVMDSILSTEENLHKENADTVKEEMDDLMLTMQDFKNELDRINESRLEIDTTLAKQALDDLKTTAQTLAIDPVVIKFMGQGSDEKLITEKVDEILALLSSFKEKLAEIQGAEEGGPEVSISFFGKLSEDEKLLLSEAVDSAITSFQQLSDTIADYTPVYTVDATEAKTKLEEIKELLEYLAKTWTATLNIDINGKSVLESVKKTWDSLKDKTITLTIRKRETNQTGGEVGYSEKLQKGGSIPGYGGGDTVPSLLERGEYVQPKEIVKKYGITFMEWLRQGMMPRSWAARLMKGNFSTLQDGGLPLAKSLSNSVSAINKMASATAASRQVHVLDLRVDDVSMPVRTIDSPDYLSSGIKQLEKRLNKRRLRRG